MAKSWDYLILTASNDAQAAAYRTQLALRRRLGLLGGACEALVVADPEGRRVGSGASTILCLIEVLSRHLAERSATSDRQAWLEILSRLRIFILHAGGDSRRLPAYGPCGKVFVPVPGPADNALGSTLFDRQWPIYAELPAPADRIGEPDCGDAAKRGKAANCGEVVVASGDVFLGFSPAEVQFAPTGFCGLGCPTNPDQARHHGVYCADREGRVRRFLQKPSPDVQAAARAINHDGQAILDIGVVHFDAATALRLLEAFEVQADANGRLRLGDRFQRAVFDHGIDFYRELCCALGYETTWEDYVASVRAAGSTLGESLLKSIFSHLWPISSRVQVLGRCDFLHFGTTGELIASGQHLIQRDNGVSTARPCLMIHSWQAEDAAIQANGAWIEGCRVAAHLELAAQNVVVGVDVDEPLRLPAGACLDVLPGRNRSGEPVFFVRCYHTTDRFNVPGVAGAVFCGVPLDDFLAAAAIRPDEVWPDSTPAEDRGLWTARLFSAERDASAFRRWLWMFDPARASAAQYREWRDADRYSFAEMSFLADQEAFFARRTQLHGDALVRSLDSRFHPHGGLTAADIGLLLAEADSRTPRMAKFLEAVFAASRRAVGEDPAEAFLPSRILHSVGTAVDTIAVPPGLTLGELFRGLDEAISPETRDWLAALGLEVAPERAATDWAQQAQRAALGHVQRAVVRSRPMPDAPMCALRDDEIVWGRSPARLDLAGGWSDTPPYSLEHGGSVTNAAVMLNGQPPIHVYARLGRELNLRIHSIDQGTQCVIRDWGELLDYGSASSDFSLVKAALVLAGLAPSDGLAGHSLKDVLARFGGGLELTTLSAVPKGSGLGTSSIMGAVVLAVIHRVLGRELSITELFHAVLCLEQALTTGGGWQDQIGGALGGVKLITTRPRLVPEPSVRYLPPDVLDPKLNQGQTLLYYTGMTRLAKNILGQVVGRYLDRRRSAMKTLREIHALAPHVAESVARRDLPAFGAAIDAAWSLNKELDPDSSNPRIEAILAAVRPHLFGAKLLGAGGGGFLLMVCKSPADAREVKRRLEGEPPNERARFFDFEVSPAGLAVSVC